MKNIFQQERAPLEYALSVRYFLYKTFPDGMDWEEESYRIATDLSPHGFFLRGHLKSKNQATNQNT